jgi:hypothetical protein
MTGLQVADLRRRARLTTVEFGALIGVASSTVARWELFLRSDTPPMVESSRRVFLMLMGLNQSDLGKVSAAVKKDGWRVAWSLLFAKGVK